MSRFTIGNKQSLNENESADVLKELKKFHEKFYSSNLMTLVIYSQHSLKDLQNLLYKADFSKIKNKKLQKPDFSKLGKPVDDENLGKFYKMKTFSD